MSSWCQCCALIGGLTALPGRGLARLFLELLIGDLADRQWLAQWLHMMMMMLFFSAEMILFSLFFLVFPPVAFLPLHSSSLPLDISFSSSNVSFISSKASPHQGSCTTSDVFAHCSPHQLLSNLASFLALSIEPVLYLISSSFAFSLQLL